jgi:Kef-type K+ transport system membrane component KefB
VAQRRLLVYYAVIAVLTAGVCVVVLTLGSSADAQRAIAGGYDVDRGSECLGQRIDLRQSGQFVGLQRADGANAGGLRFRDGRLQGDVTCRNGRQVPLRATRGRTTLAGTLGDAPLRATFAREPPEPGAQRPAPPGSIAGSYTLVPRSACLGERVEIEGSGGRFDLAARAGGAGKVSYATDGSLNGAVRCGEGGRARLEGQAANRTIALTLTPARPAAPERVSAQKRREFAGTLAAFFVAVAVVMLAARLAGAAVARIGQPRVMGEVAAGILLGPTALGALLPDVQRALFPSDVIPYIGVAANLGLIFYMFLVGLELDLSQLRGRLGQTAAISNTGVAIPMVAGLAVAIPVYELLGPDNGFVAFALFMGVSMSITAFPVLARILVERRMLKRPLGAIALASAAIDDVSAWFLIALASAVAVAGSPSEVVRTVALAVLFVAVMGLVVRRILGRLSIAFDEAGRVPTTWTTAIFAGVLLAAWTTEEIGIALIFGAFVMGAVMPRHAGLTEDVTSRIEDFVVLLLLPLFFAYTGLRTNVLLLDRTELALVTVALVLVAILCKFGGTMLAARVTGLGWRESAVLGTLLNTRGLTELIVLNLALEKGVISEALFAALVIMALVTTFMAGPVLRLLDPQNRYGAPVEEELEEAREAAAAPLPVRSILVAPQADASTAQLLAVAEPLVRTTPPRELILVRLVSPPRAAAVRGGLQTESFVLSGANVEVQRARTTLLARGVPAVRAVAFTSTDPGGDLTRLVEREEVDLLLLDGRRPLVGGAVPRGDVGTALRDAPCDVAVLVAREGANLGLGPDTPVLVPFGGKEHDWAALELAAWLSSATRAPLRLLGSTGQTEDGRDASRLLANASLLVQAFIGVAAQTVLAPPGREGVLQAARDASLLVVGLSDRWREEGLGPMREDLASAAPAPILFVRRGTRAGALAPRDDVTRFGWSSAAPAPLGGRRS